MDGDNLALVVGTYSEAGAAAEDFKALKAGQDGGDYKVSVAALRLLRNGVSESNDVSARHRVHDRRCEAGLLDLPAA